MNINYGESGAVAGGIAKGIGQAIDKKQEEQFRLDIIAAAKDWERQKMLMNSQQDFAHEMRMRQAELDREARAQEWFNEKLELVSRLDFEQEEKERQRKKSIFNSGIDTIDKNEGLSDSQKDIAKFMLASKYTDTEEAGQYLGLKPQTQKTGLFNLGGEEASMPTGVPGVPTADNPLGLNITETPVSTLPQAVLALEQESKFEVISPDGKQETIDSGQWPDYKTRGYVLAQIRRLRDQRRTIKEPSLSELRGFGGRGF